MRIPSEITATTGETILLDGHFSDDPDGGPVVFAWIQIDGPVIVGIAAADSSVAAVVADVAGEYQFRVVVTNSSGKSSTGELLLRVIEPDVPPDDGLGDGDPDVDDPPGVDTDPPTSDPPPAATGELVIEAFFSGSGIGSPALVLDGDGDAAIFGPTAAVAFDPLTDDYSVELILALHAPPESRALILSAAASDGVFATPFGIDVRLEAGAAIAYGYTISGRRDEISFGRLEPFAPAHLVFLVRRGFLLAFRDGQLLASVERLGDAVAAQSRSYTVGGTVSPADLSVAESLEGTIDNLGFWSRALTTDEIRLRFQSGIDRNAEGLAGLWDFDDIDDSGDVPDLSGHNPSMRLLGHAHLAQTGDGF